jgi:membrane-bound ClpP family serine protease
MDTSQKQYLISILDELAIFTIIAVALFYFGEIFWCILVLILLIPYCMVRYLIFPKGSPLTGKEGMVGMAGVSVTKLEPEGTVKIHGELWKARAIDDKIGENEGIVVSDVKGVTLLVRAKNSNSR